MTAAGSGEFRFSSDWAEACGSDRDMLFSPVMAGLPVGAASALAILPIHDANGWMLEAVSAGAPARGSVTVGVLAVDPLRRWTRIFRQLRTCGVTRLATWPSVGVFGRDLQEDLEPHALGYDREVAFVQEAAGEGFHVTATVFDASQAARMAAAGAGRILLHPPLPQGEGQWGDAAMRDWLREQAQTTETLNVEILLYVEADGPTAIADLGYPVARYGA